MEVKKIKRNEGTKAVLGNRDMMHKHFDFW